MLDFYRRLEKWRKERGLDRTQGFEFNVNTQVSFFTEEITEFLRAKDEHEKIDALCDITIFAINGINLIDNDYSFIYPKKYNRWYDGASIGDIISQLELMFFSNNECKIRMSIIINKALLMIEYMGYDYKKCMDETLKEIESRTGEINPNTGKWEKYKTDEAKAKWYKANYSRCKKGSK